MALPEGGLWRPLQADVGGWSLKILVFIKEVPDTRVPIICEEPAQKLRTEWNVPMLNPADQAAIHAALKMKHDIPGSHITVIHLGPVFGERWIREGLALGCDDGVRLWDEGFDVIHAQAKALIFARVASILKFDLMLTGSRSLDTGNGQIGALIATQLRIPCVCSAVTLEVGARKGTIMAARRLAQGYHERVEAPFPLVAAMEAHEEPDGDALLPSHLDATEKAIPCLDLADLGIPGTLPQLKDAPLSYGPLRFPKARLRFAAVPDSASPAFVRIKMLIEGTLTRREGRIVTGEEDYMVEELFQALRKGGWLDHLR
jgi:electron transfer flavoprotein beta subunit